jgi:Fur family ferric uptake transcriptional regulator
MAIRKTRRSTRQRQVVLDELRKLTSHPTAAELHEIARRRLPKLSLATVYRNLELLARMGAIRKLEIAGGETRYDADLDRHYHVRCLCCGRVDDMHGVPVVPLQSVYANSNGYEVIGHRLEFVGVCPACSAAAGASPEGPLGAMGSTKAGGSGRAGGVGEDSVSSSSNRHSSRARARGLN